MEGRPGHRTHREPLQHALFTVQIGVRFIPMELCLDPPVLALRKGHLVCGRAQHMPALVHILPHPAPLEYMLEPRREIRSKICRAV